MDWHRRRAELEPEGPDPVDEPYEPRPLKPGEEPCAYPGCVVPIARIGGHWLHVRKAGGHRARPIPSNGAIKDAP